MTDEQKNTVLAGVAIASVCLYGAFLWKMYVDNKSFRDRLKNKVEIVTDMVDVADMETRFFSE